MSGQARTELLQPVHLIDDATKLRPVEQIVNLALSGEEHFRKTAGRCRESLRFGQRHFALRDQTDRELHDHAQAAKPSRFIVDFGLCGTMRVKGAHP